MAFVSLRLQKVASVWILSMRRLTYYSVLRTRASRLHVLPRQNSYQGKRYIPSTQCEVV